MSLSDFLTVDMDADSHSAYAHSNSWTPTVYSTMASPNITPADDVVPSWLASTGAPSLSVSDYSAQPTAAPPSIVSPSPTHACIPGGLSQISLSSSDSERSLSPELTTLPAGFHLENPAVSAIKHLSPHPYSISPSNTTALFTRASSVSSMSSENMSGKKSRAPPSGPISTKDFIPPDVSGLSKREARLVKNRAAAFLSRQRKREEFEGLEARVQVLEADNARLYAELDEARSNPSPTPQSSSTYTPADAAALAAELAGLKRQLAARDAELKTIHSRLRGLVNVQEQLTAERERSAERDAELEALRRKVEDESTAAGSGDEEDVKVGRGAGGMAFMVLLFSLSTLLTQGNTPSTPARPARALGHRRGDSQTFLGASDYLTSPSYTYPGLSGSSSFASLAKDVPSSTPTPVEQETLRKAAEKAISGVKSTNPGEYEFDFHLPHSATPVSVRVKAPGTRLPSDNANALFDTFPSPFEFRPDDDLDFSGTRASPAATVVSSPPAIGKRKRVVEVEFAMPQPAHQRRKMEDEWMGMGGEWSMPILGV